jgi:K+/H+ antiporter YhaU regulatory subunit KhtT
VSADFSFYWDVVSGGASTWEFYARMKHTGSTTVQRRYRVFGRAEFSAEGSATAPYNALGVYVQGTGNADTRTVTNGNFTSGGANADALPGASQNAVFEFVCGYDGENVYAKRWLHDDEEPAEPQYVWARSNSFPAGLAAVFNPGGNAAHTIEFDSWGIGTEGDAAPRTVLATGPTVSSTTKLQGGYPFTITGTGFGATQGTGSVIISPTDLDSENLEETGPSDPDAVVQTIADAGDWSNTSITIASAATGDGPASAIDAGDTVYVFVTNDAEEEMESGFAVQVADPVLRVNELLRDTDSGVLVTESVEVIVLDGSPFDREVVYQNDSEEIASGVLTIEEAEEVANVSTMGAEYVVVLIGDNNRAAVVPATVVDRNDG